MVRLLLPLLLAILLPPIATLVLASTLAIGETDVEMTTAPENLTASAQSREDLLRRLATTIAFRAGLIRLASPEETEKLRTAHPDSYPPGAIWLGVWAFSICSESSTPAAIIATESYLRPAFIRRSEHIAAEIVEGLTGYWPDWSYGPAQVRPTTALRILGLTEQRLAKIGLTPELTISRVDLVAKLMDACAAATLVELSLLVSAEAGDGPAEHALRHLGGKRIPTLPGVIEYTSMVAEVTNVMAGAKSNSTELGAIDTPSNFEESTEETINPPTLPAIAKDWGEPLPRFCVLERSYGVELLPVSGEAPGKASSGILIDGYFNAALSDTENPPDWQSVALFLTFHAKVAEAAGLEPDNLRAARAETYPKVAAFLQDSRCSALVLAPPP